VQHVEDELQASCYVVVQYSSNHKCPKEDMNISSILVKEEKIELFNKVKEEIIELTNNRKEETKELQSKGKENIVLQIVKEETLELPKIENH
jgi:hypothetical protein